MSFPIPDYIILAFFWLVYKMFCAWLDYRDKREFRKSLADSRSIIKEMCE